MREQIGKYKILQRLGKGAMGEVHLAEDSFLDRQVAIKTIHSDSALGEEGLARFKREAKATAGMSHPNIVTVYDFGQEDDLVFLVMEYVQGPTLDTLITGTDTSKTELLEVLAQICDGLAYAHEQGVVHRDIKPANILVTRKGDRPLAKLVDFGVAQVAQSSLTQEGIWMGTINYLAPEYIDTGKAGPSADLFAIGVILYEILSGGRKPFSGESTTSVLNAILRSAPAPLRPDDLKQVPPGVLALVKKALSKNPAERFQSADLMAKAIREALLGPGSAEPPTLPTAAPKPAPRNRDRKPLVVGRGPQATCLSLKLALRQAEAGMPIRVLPGTYRESLVLDKDVSLIAEGGPVILESPLGPCLTLRGGQIRLQGLEFRAAPGHPSPLVEVLSGQAILEACTFEVEGGTALLVRGPGVSASLASCHLKPGLAQGLALREGAAATLEDCRAQGFQRDALSLGQESSATLKRCTFMEAAGTALLVHQRSQATLEDCDLEDCRGGGIEVASEGRLQARRCHFTRGAFAGVIALEQAQVDLEDCSLSGMEGAGLHAARGARIQLRQTRIINNPGYGLTLLDQSLMNAEECEFMASGWPGLFLSGASTAQLRNCKVSDGASYGIVSARQAKGVLEACEIAGNALTGARVESGCSLLLIRCILRDGHDTGLLLYKDAEATLEECVVHRNARGGILLAKDASDPILRGGNRIEDELLRQTPRGPVKLAPVKRGNP